MIIRIDELSDVPIYQQIRNQIVMGISDGSLSPGEQLPTVRALALELGINIMTVSYQKKAQNMPVEKDVLSATEIISSEHGGTPDWGKYVDALQVETSAEIKKIMKIGMYDFISSGG